MQIKYTKENIIDLNTLIPDGEYECRIVKTEQKTSANGNDYLTITFAIRDDIEQECQNKRIFYNIFKDPQNPNQFNEKKVNKLLNCVPEGELEDGQIFEEVKDFLDVIRGINLVVSIRTSFDEYKGCDANYVYYVKPSKEQAKTLVKEEVKPQAQAPLIEDDGLPF